MSDFSSLGLSDWLIQQCKQLGITKPSPVQENCVPPILQGRDCLGSAKTGSGKTAAFVLPVLQKLSEGYLMPGADSYQGTGVPDRRTVPSTGETSGSERLHRGRWNG